MVAKMGTHISSHLSSLQVVKTLVNQDRDAILARARASTAPAASTSQIKTPLPTKYNSKKGDPALTNKRETQT